MSAGQKPKPPRIVHQAAAQFYDRFVESIKRRIRTAQVKVALAANAELVLHSWEIGRDILASQKRAGWGARVMDRLANTFSRSFRSSLVTPLATSNTCALFAEAWPDREIVQQL